jgi:hypothetical protein
MSHIDDEHKQEPWYRNPWVWLLIAIPSLTVAGCLFTAYLALSNPDYLVGEYVAGPAPPTAEPE